MLRITELPWDSEFFGCKIGHLKTIDDTYDVEDLRDTVNRARETGFGCLYFETDFNRPLINAFCSQSGFLLVDIKTTLFKQLDQNESPSLDPSISSDFSIEHLPALELIADEISLKSRFAHDPSFGPEKSSGLFRRWLRKSLLEGYCDAFFSYMNGKGPAGFITVKKKTEGMVIDLLGVEINEQKKGIAATLLQAAEIYASNKGESKLSVTTQGYNIAAMRFYQKSRFAVEKASLFYHIRP